jgi:hypothetical protein
MMSMTEPLGAVKAPPVSVGPDRFRTSGMQIFALSKTI